MSRLKNLFYVIASAWMIFVSCVYFQEHPYHRAFTSLRMEFITPYIYSIIYFGLSIGVIYLVAQLLKNKNKSIIPVLGIFIACSVISLTLTFHFKGFEIYKGPLLVQNEAGELLLEEAEDIGPKDTILVKEGFKFFNNKRPEGKWIPEMEEYVERYPYLKYMGNSSIKIVQRIIMLAALIILFIGIGARTTKLINKNKEIKYLEYFLFSIANGSMIFAMYLMFVAAIGMLNIWAVGIFGIISIVVGHKDISEFLDNILKEVEFKTNLRSYTFFVVAIMMALFVNFFLKTIIPLPLSIDDYSVYMKLPKILAEQGGLIGGYSSYPVALIYSVGFMVTKDVIMVSGMSFLFGVLAFMAFYNLARKFFSNKISIIITSIFILTPTISTQFVEFIKTEMVLLFFAIMGITAFCKWVKLRKTGITRWLALALFIIGFTFSIKYTALILIFSTLVVLSYYLAGMWLALSVLFANLTAILIYNPASLSINNIPETNMQIAICATAIITIGLFLVTIIQTFKMCWGKIVKKLSCLIIAGAIIAMPMTPWIAKNYIEIKSGGVTINGLLRGGKDIPKLEFPNCQLSNRGDIIDYSRSIGLENDMKLSKFWMYPWYVTMTTGIKNKYQDIGPMFLGLIPVLFLMIRRKEVKEKNSVKALMLFSGSYYLYWALMAKGIVWYAITGFPILAITLGVYFKKIKNKLIKIVTYAVTTIFIVSMVLSWNVNWLMTSEVDIAHLSGFMNKNEMMNSRLKGVLEIVDVLNNEKFKDGRILSTMILLQYFIEDSHERLIPDQYANNETCFGQLTDEEKKNFIRENNVRFILVAKKYDPIVQQIDPEEYRRIQQATQKVLDFGAKELKIEYISPIELVVFRVPDTILEEKATGT
jgi:hypothetical protein